jgi:hypothetical protein
MMDRALHGSRGRVCSATAKSLQHDCRNEVFRRGFVTWIREKGRYSQTRMEDAASLRAQAARCRRLAGMVTTPDVIETLRQMAREYDARADALEAGNDTR